LICVWEVQYWTQGCKVEYTAMPTMSVVLRFGAKQPSKYQTVCSHDPALGDEGDGMGMIETVVEAEIRIGIVEDVG
jgi:hypothetical protein